MTRIAIYSVVAPGTQTGVGRQLHGLLAGLQQIDRDNDYTVYGDPRQPIPLAAPNFRPYPVRASVDSRLRNHLFTAFALPLLAARQGMQVVHIPNTMPLVIRRRPAIVTIFDLTEYALPERVYGRRRHAYRRLANRLAARRANTIITTSANTRADLLRYLDVPSAKIRVIYPGLDHDRFRPLALSPGRRARLNQTYGLTDRFLLYVGKIQPRKNLGRLLQAFGQLRRTYGDLHLVLAGRRGWMHTDIDRAVERLDLAGAVHFTGFVADADLPALYNLAEMLVFPSLYEGFGFPVLEAMACGTPVVTSATSSLGEVAGDAAHCVNPSEAGEIAAAIETVLRDRDGREALVQKGFGRAREFTWQRCATETLACYQAAASVASGRAPVTELP